ncbi:MAG: response regulator transcription factor [Flavisolibacter sp.]|jgi:DNA-binding NarL/FixJ family response regulator|nr:response regulator transcription factor [Flavisolibacter sp.]
MKYYTPSYNLLIADDHQLIIDGLCGILKDEKIIDTIHSAVNGQDAIDKVMSEQIDCVLMDINMPVVNGYEATKIIKQKRPDIKVIVVSMISDASVVIKFLKAGADAFILKDTGKDELLKAIEKVMNNEKYVSNELNLNLYQHLSLKKNSTSNNHLTPRETEIVGHIANGMTNHEIAEKLFLSTSTVDTHRKNILAKLSLKNTAALVKYAAENNLL